MDSPRLHIRFVFVIAILFALLILPMSCKREAKRLYPYGWLSTTPEFDSLTLRAERAFLDMESDSVIEQVVNQMAVVAHRTPEIPEHKARYHYWHARSKLRAIDIDGAMDEFRAAIAMTDSARNPYDVARIRWNMELEEPTDAEGYFRTVDKLNLFKEFNDIPMQAAYLMSLGGLMNQIGSPQAAIGYFTSADSLLRIAGLYGQLAGNVINRARTLETIGMLQEAAALLKVTLEDTLICKEPIAVNIAKWNLYLLTDSLPLLLDVYAGVDRDLEGEEMKPLYGSALVKEYAKRDMKDSLLKLMPIVERDSDKLERNDFRRDYYISLARGNVALGNYQEAAENYEGALKEINDLGYKENSLHVTDLDTRLKIEEKLYSLKLRSRDRTLIFLSIALVVLILFIIAIIFYRRRYIAQMKAKIEAESQNEQTKRKVIALELAMEENRRLSEDLHAALNSLKKEGLVTPAASGALDATLRTHNLTRQTQESFVETFSEMDPEFMAKLDSKYPGLSKSERRLAAYIAIGLDNKHIGRMIGVRPESVKQARWRLRIKLNLPEGVTLDDAIRGL